MLALWIEMLNRGGVDTVITTSRSGRRRKEELKRVRDLLVLVLSNPAQASEVHWTGVKLPGHQSAEFDS